MASRDGQVCLGDLEELGRPSDVDPRRQPRPRGSFVRGDEQGLLLASHGLAERRRAPSEPKRARRERCRRPRRRLPRASGEGGKRARSLRCRRRPACHGAGRGSGRRAPRCGPAASALAPLRTPCRPARRPGRGAVDTNSTICRVARPSVGSLRCREELLDAMTEESRLTDAIRPDQRGRDDVGLARALWRTRSPRPAPSPRSASSCVSSARRAVSMFARTLSCRTSVASARRSGISSTMTSLHIVGQVIDATCELLADRGHPCRNAGVVLRHTQSVVRRGRRFFGHDGVVAHPPCSSRDRFSHVASVGGERGPGVRSLKRSGNPARPVEAALPVAAGVT